MAPGRRQVTPVWSIGDYRCIDYEMFLREDPHEAKDVYRAERDREERHRQEDPVSFV